MPRNPLVAPFSVMLTWTVPHLFVAKGPTTVRVSRFGGAVDGVVATTVEVAVVGPVAVFLRDLQASARPETTLRAYATALLRWFRFLWAIEVPWDQATRAEARDFCCWIQLTVKPGHAGRRDEAGPGRLSRRGQ